MSGERRKFLVTAGRAVAGNIIVATSREAAALEGFKRKRLSGMKNGIDMHMENYVTVYELGVSEEFHPTIDYTLTGVEPRP